MKKILVACSGSGRDLAAIRQLAARGDTEVIAVALDFGDAGVLDVHDAARAAGAARCHVLDVREEFARDYMLPAIRANELVDEHDEHYSALTRRIVDQKLADIAALEGADVAAPIDSAGPEAERPRRRSRAAAPDRSADVQIAFEHGIPVSVNGVPMTLLELLDCLSTIASAHGMPGVRPEIAVLQAAHHEVSRRERDALQAVVEHRTACENTEKLPGVSETRRNHASSGRLRASNGSAARPSITGCWGTVRLELSEGVLRTHQSDYATT